MMNVPAQLAKPVIASGHVVSKLMLDLTVYLTGPTEAELTYLIDLYAGLCPPERQSKYKIAELGFWPQISRPPLTASGRAAAAAGVARAYLEPVRQRIRDGRAFELQFWDGLPISDASGSWSFGCRRIHLRSSGLHAFFRMMLPLSADPGILLRAAQSLADNVAFESGHGGLAFAYDPWYPNSAFNAVYAQSRRYWGVDIENMNDTLPLMKTAIKGSSWLTLLGRRWTALPEVETAIAGLRSNPTVQAGSYRHGMVLVAGAEPAVGDQHRADASLDPYRAVAGALEPWLLKQHPDFPGERFIDNGNTTGWIRRFVDAASWR